MKLFLALALLGPSFTHTQETIADHESCTRSAVITKSHEYEDDHNLIEPHKRAIQEIHKAYEATPKENPFPIWGDVTTDYNLTLEVLNVKRGNDKPFIVKRLTAYTEKGSVRAQTAFSSGNDKKRTKWTIIKPEEFDAIMKCRPIDNLRKMTTVYGSEKPQKKRRRSRVSSGPANAKKAPIVPRNPAKKASSRNLDDQRYKQRYAPPNGGEKYMNSFDQKNGGWGQKVPVNFTNYRRIGDQPAYMQDMEHGVSFRSDSRQGMSNANRQLHSNPSHLNSHHYFEPPERRNSLILKEVNTQLQQMNGQNDRHSTDGGMYNGRMSYLNEFHQ